MGGRVGEEIAFGPDKVTTGASDDLEVCLYIYIYAYYFFIEMSENS